MAKKKIGHIELQWRCPNCDGLNRGKDAFCASCGSPQPEDVEFEQAARQELITDEKLLKQAAAGADFHCAYCGTRNSITATTCSQCGSDITEGAQRAAGRVIGAFRDGPATQVACSSCGRLNPDTARECSGCGAALSIPSGDQIEAVTTLQPGKRKKIPVIFIIVAALICIGLAAVAILSGKTTTKQGVVTQFEWQRSIPIEAFMPVEHQDWHDELPDAAEDISCGEKFRYTSSEPVANSKEVCGTPYTVDSGSGFAEVVQDCEYQVYDDYCSYTIMEWAYLEAATVSGNDLSPYWPSPNLSNDQRLGENRSETYSVYFDAEGETYSYDAESYQEFQRYEIGSSWKLDINTFGVVVSVQP